MINTAGFTTVTPLALQRTCYVDEQDRLNEYAKALRVPIQTGQIIKGDAGPQGIKGDQGPRGLKGDSGSAGTTPALLTIEHDIATGSSSFTLSSVDARANIINLLYDDDTLDPVNPIGIKCIRYTSGLDTIVYFTAATPDDKYKLVVSSF